MTDERDKAARILAPDVKAEDLLELLDVAHWLAGSAFEGFDEYSGLPCRILSVRSIGKAGTLQRLDAVLRRIDGKEAP